jgi:hypothetical protein
MPATLSLDLGLDFGRTLPGEARFAPDAGRERPQDKAFPIPADPPQRGEAAEPDARGRLTLDEVIVGVWEGLHMHDAATCPICGGAMRARPGSGPRPVGGRCADCGTTIS